MDHRYLIGFVMLLTGVSEAVAQEKDLPGLSVTKIKIGETYLIDGGVRDRGVFGNTWGRIIQIIDDDNMLVGIDNGAGSPGGSPRYSVVVWCRFPTTGLTDEKTGFLANILGAKKVTATGTTRYKTAAGGSRTVFILAPVATKAPENRPQKDKAVAETAKKAVQPNHFVGRWKLVDDKGIVSSYLTLTRSGAKRDHAPDSPGTWEVVGNEARIKWEDGFRDILRLDKDGKMAMLALDRVTPAEATDWAKPPRFRLQAVQIPEKLQPGNKKK